MKLLYIVTKGTDDATLASVPLHIAANGSLEVGQDLSVRVVQRRNEPGDRAWSDPSLLRQWSIHDPVYRSNTTTCRDL